MTCLCLLLLALLSVTTTAHFVTLRQDAKGQATYDLIDSLTGETLRSQPALDVRDAANDKDAPPLQFSWPYAEMTSDPQRARVFSTVFPDNYNGSVLYELDAQSLTVTQSWADTPYWFFDLQHSARAPQRLFGIKVVSTYGRVLSAFTAAHTAASLSAEELFPLPYMWYVNASSFDNTQERYFALCKYFPGKPESTEQQKLLVARLSSSLPVAAASSFAVLNITTHSEEVGVLQFISYSHTERALYFASIDEQRENVFVGVLDEDTGSVRSVRFAIHGGAARVGPLAVDDKEAVVTVFVKHAKSDQWTLYSIPLDAALPVKAMKSFTDKEYAVFDAVARL